MRQEQVVALQRLQKFEFNDTAEIIEAFLEFAEATFRTLDDGRVNFGDAGAWIMVFGPVQRAIDNAADAIRELATATDTQFEEMFAAAAANFDLVNNQVETDVKGITKGLLHAVRIYARGKYQAAA